MESGPTMTAVFTPPPIPADRQHREYNNAGRPRSQPPPERRDAERQRAKKRSANHIKARPANPAVISSILDSFDALIPPPVIQADEYYSETGSLGSKRSRPYSSDGTVSSMPSVAPATSPGFGVEYGTGLAVTDDAGAHDAAQPPTIRTSRPPSGLSTFAAPSPRMLSVDNDLRLRPASINSRTSSFSSVSKEKENGNTKYKHSAESWIKQDGVRQDYFGDTQTPRKARRSLRRINSQETLRPQTGPDEEPFALGAAELKALSRAEQIIAKTPPPLTENKGRLYLTDTGIADEPDGADSPISASKSPEPSSSPPSSEATGTTEQTIPTPQRLSPKNNPIIDSIPTRTSSLRQPSSSPPSTSKKSNKKLKRQTVAAVDGESIRPDSIPESSWADLGEDDETVKRIRELREKRKSRIEEYKNYTPPADQPPRIPADTNQIPVPEPPSQKTLSEEAKRASRVRPATNRAATEPNSKARKILGLTDDTPLPGSIGSGVVNSTRPQSSSPENMRRPQSRLEEQVFAHHQTNRPGTAQSETPPLSLDYSYVKAVAALQAAERDPQPRAKAHSRQASTATSSSLVLKALDLPTRIEPEIISVSTTPTRKRSVKKRFEPQSRWTTHHPDLPLDFDRRKSRRKSMSDARRTRYLEDEPEIPRRDSVEDAVLEYLKAPRLSRKVQHPLTGRIVAFSEVGDPDGAAVFICVGMGLTRYVTAFYDDLATTLRLRLITIDRPGVGGSEPYPAGDRSGPLNWPDDVLVICQELGITRFSLLAHSAGAVYALATALTLPHLIRGKVHLLAPWIPPSQLEAISHPAASAPPAGALPRGQRILRVLPTSFLKAANSSFMNATSASLKPANKRQVSAAKTQSRDQSMSPTRVPERPSSSYRPDYQRRESMIHMDQYMPTTNPMENFPIPVKEEEEDEANLRRGSLVLSATATPTDPNFTMAASALNAAEHAEKERKVEYTSRLTQRIWELATRDSNPATDLLVCLERHREIGFRYTDVSRSVIITHGSDDKRVPLGNVKWLVDQMNSRALAGVAGDLAGDSVPQSREGWAEEFNGRGGCEIRVLEGEGHGLMASAPIMSDVLTEIAGYWMHDKGMTM